MNELERFISECKRVALENFKAGTPAKIREDIEALRRRMSISRRAAQGATAAVREVTAELEGEFVRKFAGDFKQSVVEMVSGAENTIASKMQEAVRRMKSAAPDEIAKELSRVADVQRQHVATVVQTTNAGLRRGQAVADALDAGVERFRFAGKAGVRPYWVQYGNKIMTIAQIRQTSNGQGLDPLLYGCGYNCGHRWMAVLD